MVKVFLHIIDKHLRYEDCLIKKSIDKSLEYFVTIKSSVI